MSLLFSHWKDEEPLEEKYNNIIGGESRGRSINQLEKDIHRSINSNYTSKIERTQLLNLQQEINNCYTSEEMTQTDTIDEVYLVKKGSKFMTGYGYSTGFGYKFKWTTNKEDARKMAFSVANSLAIHSDGKVVSCK